MHGGLTGNTRAIACRATAGSRHAGAPGRPRRVWVAAMPAVGLMLAGVGALAWASLPPVRADEQLVVIAAPGTSRIETVAMVAGAQGALVAPGRFANIAIATSPRVDFPAALRREGVWFVFASPRLAGCLGAAKDDPAL